LSQGNTCSFYNCNNIASEYCPDCQARLCLDHKLLHGHIRTGLKLVNLVIRIKDDSTEDGQKDINYYNKAGSQIMETIRTFVPNLQFIAHSSHTNIITLSANRLREETSSLVKKILEIRDVDGLLNFPNYIGELRDAMNTHEFFKVITYSSTLIESYGKQILTKHFGGTNKEIGHEKIGGLSFDGTAILLYYCGKIDTELFKDINAVKKERNRLIHEMSNPDVIKLLSKERLESYEDLANNAIHSLSELMAKLND
jgi:hypothetical protein